MIDLYQRLETAAGAIADLTGHPCHDVVVVLGSASGDFPEHLDEATAVPYPEIPGFPIPKVAGHSGTLYSASFGDNRVLLLAGRVHAYEGYSAEDLTFPVRACLAAGCGTLVVTNAAGGCGEGLVAGSIVMIRDHLNLAGINPLVGPNDPRLGLRFPDMSDTYTPELLATWRPKWPPGRGSLSPRGFTPGFSALPSRLPRRWRWRAGWAPTWWGCPPCPR